MTPHLFPTSPAGLPAARPPEVVELADGDEFDLRIAPVAKRLGDATVRMLAYNGSVPGVALPGARTKLVGGDSGRYERETLVEQVLIAPSERAIVDVLFEQAGSYVLEHRTPGRTYRLATIAVAGEPAPTPAEPFAALRHNADMAAERERSAAYLAADPDKTIALVGEMAHGQHDGGHAHGHSTAPIEWEDDMVEHNRQTTSANMRWKIVDRATGAEGPAIDWRFRS